MTASPHRTRPPSRRPAVTQDIIVSNITLSATIGFDETGGRPELLLSGAKDGSGVAAIIEDASVDFGDVTTALAKSIARMAESLGGKSPLFCAARLPRFADASGISRKPTRSAIHHCCATRSLKATASRSIPTATSARR